MILRIYALYNGSKTILIPLVVFLLVMIIAACVRVIHLLPLH